MFISLSTQTFDPNGSIYLKFDAKSADQDFTRRVSRTATMDGGCTYDDLGFSWSDVDLNLRFTSLSEAQENQLAYLAKTYGVLTAVTRHGAFKTLVESYSFKEGLAELKLLILGAA